MKFNPKKHVDLELTVNEFVDRLNNKCEELELNKIFEVFFKTTFRGNHSVNGHEFKSVEGKKFVTICFSTTDLETKERLVLFSTDYIFKNPAEKLTVNYRMILYKELLMNCMLGFGSAFESILKGRNAEEKINNVKNYITQG